jgi:hypothetical protein
MITLNVKQFQAGFFDRVKVDNAIDKARVRVLSKFGAFVRQRAITSLRYRKRSSRAGEKPTAWRSGRFGGKSPLRLFLYSAYDPRTETAVIGPAKLSKVASRNALVLLERGGTARGDGRTVYVKRAAGRDARGRFVTRGTDEVTLSGTLNYRPRPFMGPALEAERPKLAPMWRNSIK